MKKLPVLTAAAGLVTVFGAATAKADCQDCVPDQYSQVGGMMCWSGGGPYGACVERVKYDGSGQEIPGSKYCYVSSCSGNGWYPGGGGPYYYYPYYYYYGYWYGYYYYDWWGGCYICAAE